MYNRYIPVPSDKQPPFSSPPPQKPASSGGFFKDLLGKLNIGGIDKGDLILMLILILLCMEDGEESDMLLIIALVFLLGL